MNSDLIRLMEKREEIASYLTADHVKKLDTLARCTPHDFFYWAEKRECIVDLAIDRHAGGE